MNFSTIRTGLVGITLLFLLHLVLKKKQNSKHNWAVFYSSLWVSLSLPLINKFSVQLGFWKFIGPVDQLITIPYDLYFTWIVLWGVLVPTIFKGEKIFLICILALWFDLLFMPYLGDHGILILNDTWLLGEVLLITFSLVPSMIWTKISLSESNLKIRSLFQTSSMAMILCYFIPQSSLSHFPFAQFHPIFNRSILLQFAFIILLPAFAAVIDLAEKGKGTPFPYDPTSKLVKSGVYAYIRNPIQWSLTLFFIPLALFNGNTLLLIGMPISIFYTIGVSNPQEFPSLLVRFGKEWTEYKHNVSSWIFIWKPTQHPKGIIYFKKHCGICASLRAWFERRNPLNLEFRNAESFEDKILTQVHYIDESGHEYSSVKAIASAFNHINLAYASLGWFMRMPGIQHLLQLIVDSMEFAEKHECEVSKKGSS